MNSKNEKILYAIFVSSHCNLACDYCYFPEHARKSETAKPQMTKEIALKTLKFIATQTDFPEIGFFGIEPLLNIEVINFFLDIAPKELKNVSFSLNTNGLLLTPKLLDKFQKHKFRIGLSLDGGEQAFNSHRQTATGENSFKTIMRNKQYLLDYSPDIYIRMTITKQNADKIKEMLISLYDLGFKKVGFSFDFTQTFSEKALNGFNRSLMEFSDWYIERIKSGDTFSVASIDRIARGKRNPQSGPFCGAGVTLFAVSVDGNIFPCWRYAGEDKRTLGTVHKGLNPNSANYFKNYNENAFEACRGCKETPICARCMWVSEKSAGGTYKITKEQCAFNKAMIASAERIAPYLNKQIKVEEETKKYILITAPDGATYKIPQKEWQKILEEC